MTSVDLSVLQRPSGAFAMLAVDQREAMRNMLAEHQTGPVSDEHVRNFKLEATRVLSPFASGVLIDKQFALDQAIEQKAVAEGTALIAAADHFETANGELVGEVTIDPAVDPATYAKLGVKALKLLVIYRPDGGEEERVSMVHDFVRQCKDAGLISIIEPVSRKPFGGGEFDWDAGVIKAATELGSLGADLYKAEVPFRGLGTEKQVRDACAQLTSQVSSPWVVLSSGVPEDVFPTAVEWACKEGASGFLSGRAVWASCIGNPNVSESLRTEAVDRLKRLGDVVDGVVA